MFDSLFGAEGSLIVRFVVAFVIVLGLIALTFWLVRRFGATRVGTAAARGRQPRLAVVDAASVDGRRRLVLVRRDNVEHLLMIGGPSDMVVEQNIMRAVPVTQPREVPVPRTPGAVEAASATRPPPDEWPGPQQDLPAPRPQPEPRDLARPAFPRPDAPARPDTLARAPRPSLDPLTRPSLPQSLAPRPSEAAPIVPAVEPDGEQRPAPAGADAALANMAQRLEAALRRPGAPGAQPETPERPSLDFSPAESPATAPSTAPPRADDKAAKSKSVLDSLEEEMASLLGRPPGKE